MHNYLHPLQFLWWMCIPTQTPDEWRPWEDTTWWTTFGGFVLWFIIIRRKYLLGSIVLRWRGISTKTKVGEYLILQLFLIDGSKDSTEIPGSWITKRWLLSAFMYVSAWAIVVGGRAYEWSNYIVGGLLDEWSINRIKI